MIDDPSYKKNNNNEMTINPTSPRESNREKKDGKIKFPSKMKRKLPENLKSSSRDERSGEIDYLRDS